MDMDSFLFIVFVFLKALALVGFVMTSLIALIYAERKILGAIMYRRGPNVVGPWGTLQLFADALKFIFKEVVVPSSADKPVFFLAPLLAFVFAMLSWAVIPFSEHIYLTDINVAVLFIFAVGSLEVYGIIMGGWASNSKYPFLGSLRSVAQMISYEVSIGFILIGIIISTGSLSLRDIVFAQDTPYGALGWYWFCLLYTSPSPRDA